MGVNVTAENFVTASLATALYLKENYESKKLFVVGTNSFLNELKGFGLNVTTEVEDDISCAVVGFDNELCYTKIERICEILLTKDVDYIATNPDLKCPVGFGAIPDCGAICKLIECAVDKTPKFIGKPDSGIVSLCLERTGYSAEQTVVVGDRFYTDIACGIRAGVDTVCVFTGEASMSDLDSTEFVPTYSFLSVKELYNICAKDI